MSVWFTDIKNYKWITETGPIQLLVMRGIPEHPAPEGTQRWSSLATITQLIYFEVNTVESYGPVEADRQTDRWIDSDMKERCLGTLFNMCELILLSLKWKGRETHNMPCLYLAWAAQTISLQNNEKLLYSQSPLTKLIGETIGQYLNWFHPWTMVFPPSS